MKIFKKEIFIILLLSLICSFFFFFKLGSYKLIDVDEPRYAEAAREMLESKDWITPYFNYELRFDKPVLFYWLIALSYIVFGISEFAARFPSAILATALVFFTYYFGRTIISKSFGLISALILVSSLEFIAMARMSITDMTLTFFICASIMSGLIATFKEDRSKKFWWWFAYLFSGIAVLTKGPVGLVLPGIVLGAYLILTGKLKESLKPVFVIPGLIIFTLSVVPWYYAIISLYGSEFVNYFFLKHNFARFANFKQHVQPFYFYFIVVFAGFFPWIIYFISALIKYLPELFKQITNKENYKRYGLAIFKSADNRSKLILASSLWFLLIFLFYSSAKAKLVTYILPIFPAIALLTGVLWHDFVAENKNTRSINISARISAVICFIMAIVAIVGLNWVLPRDEKLVFEYSNFSLIAIFILIPIIGLLYLHINQKVKALSTIIILMMATSVTVITSVLPAVYNSGQKDLFDFVTFSKNKALSNVPLIAYGSNKPSIVFYSQKKIPYIDGPGLFSEYISSTQPVLIIIRNRHFKELSEFKFYLVDKGVKYSLVSNVQIQLPEKNLNVSKSVQK